MTARFEKVSHAEFQDFVSDYPRPLTHDVWAVVEPPLVSYYDFKARVGPEAMVAKYHAHTDPAKRVYMISRHLL